jgi:hypothetical protein
MSDYAHSDRRSRILIEHRTIESRAMYAAFYALFLTRAALKRLTPWRTRENVQKAGARETIFAEARTAASVMVASSFMGL